MPDDTANLLDLTGRIACVTGASSGLGQYAATVLAEAGAKVVGVARREDALKSWAAETGSGYVAHDLMDRNGLKDLADKVTASMARLTFLFMLQVLIIVRLLMTLPKMDGKTRFGLISACLFCSASNLRRR